MPPKLSDVELLLAKAALHQARLREALGIKQEDVDDQDLRRQEDELFKCEPEFAGLGYKAKDDPAAELKRKAVSSEDKLRRQILGKNAKVAADAKGPARSQAKSVVHQPDADSDDEEGRAAAFPSKRAKRSEDTGQPTVSNVDPDRDNIDPSDKSKRELLASSKAGAVNGASRAQAPTSKLASSSKSSLNGRRQAGSYLDELLAQKAKNRKKKQKKHKSHGEA